MGIAADLWEGGGAKPAKFPTRGTTFEGRIANLRAKQLEEFGTKKPEVWPDGTPKITTIVTIQTGLQEDQEDDGQRDLYLKGHLYTAFRIALKESFDHAPSDSELVGALLKVMHHQTAESRFGAARKLFKVKITPKASPGTAAETWEADEDIPF